MASAAAPTTFSSLLSSTKSTGTAASPSSSTSRVQLPSALGVRPLRRLGFAAADPLLAVEVASRVSRVRGRGARGVVSMAKRSVGDLSGAELKGKRVFVRADLNVPLDDNQNITDDTRIRAAIPTIKHLIQNGAKVILSSHLGRPKGVTPKYSLAPLVPRLSELIGIQVVKADDSIGPEVEKLVASLPDGGVLLLENVRFYKEEEKNDPEHAKKLASLADLYVNDAFGTAHRAHASTEGVTKYLKPSVAGFLLQKELDYLVGAVSNPKRPFAAIVGGSKVSSKIGVIESLLEKVDILLLGGGMIFTFYKAVSVSSRGEERRGLRLRMAKSNEESPNLNVSKPPLKRSKTLSHKPQLNLRVSVDNGIGSSGAAPSATTTTNTDFSEQQWNYPSFLGTTTRKRRPSAKPSNTHDLLPPTLLDHSDNPPKTSLLPPPPPPSSSLPPIRRPQHYKRSPIFYLLTITCIIFVPYSAYLQYRLAKLEDEKLRLCRDIDFCSSNGKTSTQKDDGSFSYILNADSRTIALYIVVFTLVLPFVLYKYLDCLPQIINFLRRTNGNKEDVPLQKRVAYMVDVFFSIYPYAKLLALLFATLFLIAFGGLALYAVTGGSFAEALWHSWTYVADSGNHAETEGTGQRIVSVSISSGGMLIFAMMLGLVSDAISEKVDSLRKGKCEVIERNHILILGWSDKLGSLLKQLAIANKSVGGGVIVVLAEKEKEEMEMDIAKLEFDFMGTSVICRSGSPLILADLKKVSVSKARAIIVLASDENADQSDARALRVVLSLTGVREGLRGHVVVEMSDLDNEPLVKLVGGELIETVVAHDVIGRLMIQCALQPGLAQIWEDILGFENAEFYIKRWPELDCLPFKDILISFPDAIPCGVKVAADGGKIVINPDDNYILRDGDEVLVIAEDDDTYAPGPLPEVRKGLFPRIRDPPKYPEKILFCGWRRDIDDMIMVLEAFLAPGSELWMFNEVPEKEREKKLAAGGLDVFGLENIKLVHREGNAVIRRHLESLPLETFDSILILADESVEDSVAHSDSRSLATLLLIRDIQSRRLPYKDTKSTSLRLSGFSHNSWIREMQQASDKSIIISEILDSRTRNLVSVSRISDYVLSNELVSMALAMVAEDKQINRVLEELFAEEGNEMCIKPAEFYLFDQEELSFYDIMIRGRARREIVIGYRLANQERAVINPSEKSAPRKWSLDDVFVVIASGD